MEKEFKSLSEKIKGAFKDIDDLRSHDSLKWVLTEDVKEFIKLTEEENSDFDKDIIGLIEINNYGKDDLIIKMKRLIKEHKKERNKLAGSKLS